MPIDIYYHHRSPLYQENKNQVYSSLQNEVSPSQFLFKRIFQNLHTHSEEDHRDLYERSRGTLNFTREEILLPKKSECPISEEFTISLTCATDTIKQNPSIPSSAFKLQPIIYPTTTYFNGKKTRSKIYYVWNCWQINTPKS